MTAALSAALVLLGYAAVARISAGADPVGGTAPKLDQYLVLEPVGPFKVKDTAGNTGELTLFRSTVLHVESVPATPEEEDPDAVRMPR